MSSDRHIIAGNSTGTETRLIPVSGSSILQPATKLTPREDHYFDALIYFWVHEAYQERADYKEAEAMSKIERGEE